MGVKRIYPTEKKQSAVHRWLSKSRHIYQGNWKHTHTHTISKTVTLFSILHRHSSGQVLKKHKNQSWKTTKLRTVHFQEN